MRVLEKNRFVQIGESSEEGTIRFELSRSMYEEFRLENTNAR
jgi:hypothetical protein